MRRVLDPDHADDPLGLSEVAQEVEDPGSDPLEQLVVGVDQGRGKLDSLGVDQSERRPALQGRLGLPSSNAVDPTQQLHVLHRVGKELEDLWGSGRQVEWLWRLVGLYVVEPARQLCLRYVVACLRPDVLNREALVVRGNRRRFLVEDLLGRLEIERRRVAEGGEEQLAGHHAPDGNLLVGQVGVEQQRAGDVLHQAAVGEGVRLLVIEEEHLDHVRLLVDVVLQEERAVRVVVAVGELLRGEDLLPLLRVLDDQVPHIDRLADDRVGLLVPVGLAQIVEDVPSRRVGEHDVAFVREGAVLRVAVDLLADLRVPGQLDVALGEDERILDGTLQILLAVLVAEV